MTISEQLELYKKALRDYRLSLWFPWLKRKLETHEGFCCYFDTKVENNDYVGSLFYLTELNKLEPADTYMSSWWFWPGRLRPRIKILKLAIKNCQALLRDDTK
jgi:hypothetical protein